MSEIKLSNVATQSGRRSFVGGSDASVIVMDTDQVRREGAEPEAGPVRAAHAEFVRVLVGKPPRTIPLMADAIDLEDRADHLGQVFWALSAYVTVVLDDTAQNVPGRLDLRDAEGVLADLASDVTGAIQKAADDMAGRPA
jgi:hypothetical protein